MREGKDDLEMQKIAKECESEVITMFKEACEQEKDWAEYLFPTWTLSESSQWLIHGRGLVRSSKKGGRLRAFIRTLVIYSKYCLRISALSPIIGVRMI
jgi:hypothetical protein